MGKIITADKMVGQCAIINWRPYYNTTSLSWLYDTGVTTYNASTPFAYGTIPIPFDCYLDSVIITNNPYSTYANGPTATTTTIYAYKNLVSSPFTEESSVTVNHGSGVAGETAIFNFGTSVSLDLGDKLQLKIQCDGAWYYTGITITLKQK